MKRMNLSLLFQIRTFGRLVLLLLIFGSFTEIPGAVEIGNRRELFLDRLLIESMDGLDLRLHHPHREGVALAFDQPWEGPFSAYATVIFDSGLYRMYYRGLPETQVEGRLAVTCYAESDDGIHWRKPNLGLFDVAGTRENNVILAEADGPSHNFSPFLDTRPGIPVDERFKAVAGIETEGIQGFISADGIHWRLLQDDYLFTEGMFDSHNVAFWSESEQQYLCYFRTWTGEGFTGWRTISRATSHDFRNWSEPVEMTYGDTPPEHLYTNGTHPYFRAPHIYIGLAKRFFPEQPGYTGAEAAGWVTDPRYAATSSDSVLMTTRGSNLYDRTFMEAFIRPGPSPQDWIARDNTPALGVVPLDTRTLGMYRMSHYAQSTAHLARYTLRTDGFASVHADYEGGILTTVPLIHSGSVLEINFQTSAAGAIQIELLDEAGRPIPGFTYADCPPMRGDFIDHAVHWRDHPDLESTAGKPLQLRFHLRDGDLYAFRFR